MGNDLSKRRSSSASSKKRISGKRKSRSDKSRLRNLQSSSFSQDTTEKVNRRHRSVSSLLSASSFVEQTPAAVHFAGVFADEESATRTVSAQERNFDKAAKLIKVLCSSHLSDDVQGDVFDMRFSMIKVLRENVLSWEADEKDSEINRAIFEFYGSTANKALDVFMNKHCGGAGRSGNDRYDIFFALSTEQAREACESENEEVMMGGQISTLRLLLGAHTQDELGELMKDTSPPTPPMPTPSTGQDADVESSEGEAADINSLSPTSRIEFLLSKVEACQKASASFAQRQRVGSSPCFLFYFRQHY